MNLFNKGTVLAGAAWALFAACGGGSSSTPSGSTAPAAGEPAAAEGDQAMGQTGSEAMPATAENVKCSGVNECKGHGSCSGAANSCKGMNECKGKGWVEASAADCTSRGGSVAQ